MDIACSRNSGREFVGIMMQTLGKDVFGEGIGDTASSGTAPITEDQAARQIR